ncbi:type I-F CRISPR-associated protein Csy3 [Rheinheimera sp. UJ63]|uniref:type I-F CRISPR-associated protein Csy3 n=1 Tax=Rheinheimera sp. UJ63 TaxID=2910157 RepID=UPI001F446547|nr:type I-F CRISPR-associated protein Csy3 [Rheinheimera sp. UJ63]MCF4010984.1 type I-F CRISPR-associated protein Csy3 [Rheinheimera sp. UJ63]
MSEKLKTPSVLAFEAKLSNSDAIMASGNWEERANSNSFLPVFIKEKAVRGTISNRLNNKDPKFNDPAKLDAEVAKPNPQTVDNASLPFEHDTLKVSFTLRVIGDLATPSTCNDPAYQQALANLINGYAEQTQFTELANRYAANIANGRFLWRNRVGAEAIEVQVTHGNELWVFDSQQFDLRSFAEPTGDLAKLAQVIKQGLTGESFALLKVNAFAKLGPGQAVYPSQELVMKEKNDKSAKSKFLYQLNGIAAMHSQKIGNALRSIDTWHPSASEVGAIAVEPYGSVTNRGKAYRHPTDSGKLDFYSLIDSWVLKGKTPPLEQQHYIMAMFIRGGVFGEAG